MSREVQLELSLVRKIQESISQPNCSRIVVIINYTINIKTYCVPRTSLDLLSEGASRTVELSPEVQLDVCLARKVQESTSPPLYSRKVVVVVFDVVIIIINKLHSKYKDSPHSEDFSISNGRQLL
jgi:hypothetical protein